MSVVELMILMMYHFDYENVWCVGGRIDDFDGVSLITLIMIM